MLWLRKPGRHKSWKPRASIPPPLAMREVRNVTSGDIYHKKIIKKYLEFLTTTSWYDHSDLKSLLFRKFGFTYCILKISTNFDTFEEKRPKHFSAQEPVWSLTPDMKSYSLCLPFSFKQTNWCHNLKFYLYLKKTLNLGNRLIIL